MSNREIGDKFEQKCIDLLEMRGTYGSGACIDDADLKDEHLIIECKVKNNQSGVSIPKSLITKVNNQAEKWHRDWAIAYSTQAGEYVTMPLNVFAEIYEVYRNAKGQQR